MKKLSLLILCLLVLCNSFSQTDTLSTNNKPKYVFLTETQARANIKELIAYDALKLISAQQENRIVGFQEQITLYENVIISKDSIITEKDAIIKLQDKIVKTSWLPKIHGYAGVDFLQFDFNDPTFYFRTALEFKTLSVGAQLHVKPVDNIHLPNVYGTFRAELRIF